MTTLVDPQDLISRPGHVSRTAALAFLLCPPLIVTAVRIAWLAWPARWFRQIELVSLQNSSWAKPPRMCRQNVSNSFLLLLVRHLLLEAMHLFLVASCF